MKTLKQMFTQLATKAPRFTRHGVSVISFARPVRKVIKRNKGSILQMVASGAIVLTAAFVALFSHPGAASAFGLMTQNNWSGGVGTGSNQYTSIQGLDTSIGNELRLDTSAGAHTWCNTAKCNSSWDRRMPIHFSRTNDSSSYTDVNVQITVHKVSTMDNDFTDLRFVNKAGDTDLRHYIVNGVGGDWATVLVHFDTYPANDEDIYMYYGNTNATNENDASILTINGDIRFQSKNATYVSKWNGSAGAGQFSNPKGLARDTNENIYVADTGNHRIQKFDANGNFILSWGSQGNGDNEFESPVSVAYDPGSGLVYVLDSVLNRVQIFNPQGLFVYKFGTAGTGVGELNNPQGLAVCPSGGVYIANTGNNTVEWFNKNSGASFSYVGGYGSGDAEFDEPTGITIVPAQFGDYSCHIAVSDTGNNRIQWFNDDLTPGSQIDGDKFVPFGTSGSGPGQLDRPTGVWFDALSQVLYVSDTGNHRVEMFNSTGRYFGEWGQEGSQDGQFTSPIAVIGNGSGGSGRVWTLDKDTGRLQVFDDANLAYKYQSHYGYAVSDEGDALLTRGWNSWFGPVSGPDRSVSRVSETELIQGVGTMSCTDNQFAFGLTVSGQVHLSFDMPCENGQRYLRPYEFFNGYTNDGYNPPDQVRIPVGGPIRLRVVNYSNNESSVFYSVDAGRTYTYIADNPFTNPDPPLPFLVTGDSPFGAFTAVRSMIQYNAGPAEIKSAFGIEEYHGGYSGYVESRVFDLGSIRSSFGNIHVDSTGTGIVGLYVRTGIGSPSGDDYVYCGLLPDSAALADSLCGGENGARYVQYRFDMSGDSSASLHVQGVSFEYVIDDVGPSAVTNLTVKKGQNGAVVPDNGWFNSRDINHGGNPYFSWDASTDNAGGSGVKGYCLYLGTNPDADPATTPGVLYDNTQNGYDGIPTAGICRHLTDQTHVAIPDNWDILYDQPLYFKAYAVDNSGNIQSAPVASARFRVDTQNPVGYTVITGPDVGNSKIFSVNFVGTAPAVIGDEGPAGIAGFKYCVSKDPYNNFPECTGNENWYGPGHTGDGTLSPDHAGLISQGGFTTTPADAGIIDGDGTPNFVFLSVIDNAGNSNFMLSAGTTPFVIALVTQQAASSPRTLNVNPGTNVQNNFSFSWTHPETFLGLESQINYCYTVNEAPASDGHNCRWTGEGITQLNAGPYATQQGQNTLYLMARDKTQNFSTSNVTSVDFTATTIAPGVPQSLESSDVSVRASSAWKLALSWAAPSQTGSGVASYKILRSLDGVNYSQVGSTTNSNLSFIDSGLSQVTYYYQVKACDNAGSCGGSSNTVSRKPLGRFTTPANLIVGGGRPVAINIGTRKATIQWQTDRESDSRVAIGTASGQYAPDETGNSSQITDHSINLTNLQPGTQYYYVAKWTDADGNTGVSPERSFMTAPAPNVGEVSAQGLSVSGATIHFTTRASLKARVYYGKTAAFGGMKEINTAQVESNYSIVLSELSDDTKYFYKVTTRDSDGNEYDGDTYTFTTPALPKISQLQFSAVEDAPKSTLRVTWITNMPTNSEVNYGLVNGTPVEKSDPQLKTEHEILIDGLADGSQYSLVARSRNAAGDTATSDRSYFTTALDTRPPKISDVVVETAIRGTGTEARGQITVAWKTDEPSTSQVAFGQGQSGDYTGRTTIDTRLTTEHVVVVSDLPTSSIYRVQAVSADSASNIGKADASSVIIGRAVDNIFSIIFNTLQRIFGL